MMIDFTFFIFPTKKDSEGSLLPRRAN